MTRLSVRAATALLAIASLAACSDSSNPAAPQAAKLSEAERLRLINAPAAAPVKAPKASLLASVGDASPSDTVSTGFDVGPEGGVFPIGRHWIAFPANSVCDPSQSTYGEGEWNNDCVIASQPVHIDAKTWEDSTGTVQVDFAQHLRFDPTKQVILHIALDARETDSLPAILWHKTDSSAAVNEGENDPALVTKEGNYWMVYRRVKHFSGYLVSCGRTLDVSIGGIDVSLRKGSLGAGPRMSGHVVATGRSATVKP